MNRNIATLAAEINTQDAVTGERIPAHRQAFARALDGEWVTQDVLVTHRLSRAERVVRCAASPVLLNGKVIAAVAVNTDVTELHRTQALIKENESQQAYLIELTDSVSELTNPVEIQEMAGRLLGEYIAADRTYYVWMDDERQVATVEQDYVRGKSTSFAGEHAMHTFESMLKIIRTGQPFITNDVLTIPDLHDELETYVGLGLRAFVAMPLFKKNKLMGAMCITSATPREWTAGELMILNETAKRTWAAVERARAEERLRENEKRQSFLLELSDALRFVSDPVAIQELTTRLLGSYLEVDRCYYAWCDARAQTALIESDYIRQESFSLKGLHRYADFGIIAEVMATGKAFVAYDVVHMPEVAPYLDHYLATGLRAVISVPLIKVDELVAGMAVTTAVPREWTRSEILLIEEVAERTWAAVEWARADKALQESERRLASFVASSSDMVHRLSADAQDLYILSGSVHEAGFKIAQRKWMYTYFTDGEHVRVIDAINDAIAEKKMFEIEYSIIKSDGTTRWFFSRAIPIINEDGEILEWIGTASDITPRKIAEQQLYTFNRVLERKVNERTAQLKESRDLLQSVLDTALLQILILEAIRDEHGRIIDLKVRLTNKEQEKESGRDDLVGKQFLAVYPWIKDSGIFELIIKTIESETPQQTEYSHLEDSAERWFSASFVKLNDGVVWTTLDISKRKFAEQEQNKSYMLLQQSEELAGLGSWEYDRFSETLTWSKGMYQLFQLAHETSVTPETYLHYASENGQKVAEWLALQLREGEADFSETLALIISGQLKFIRLKAAMIRNESGEVLKVLGNDMDITAAREAEEKIIQMASRQQREIVRVTLSSQEEERRRISESLHNGLGQLLYAVKISMTQLTSKQAVNNPLAFAESKRYTDNLLKDAIGESRRISHELMPQALQQFGLKAAIDETCRQLSLGVDFTYEFSGLDKMLDRYIELAIYRIVQELMLNVVKHSQATRAVTEIKIDPSRISISVSDNGIGMQKDEISRKGIGLASIKSRVKLLNGEVKIDSETGRGTLVSVNIPI